MAIYLDNAATSFPKPDCVYSAVDDFMRHNGAAFGRGSHAAGDAAGQIVTQCRHRLARLLDAESDDRIAFTFNCTDGINLLLRGLLNVGDRVVTTTLEHNSVLRTLHQLRKELKIDVVHVDFDRASGLVDSDQLRSEINRQRTRLVVLNHASNVTGAIQHVSTVAALAHEAGALFLLDAAQTTGHLPFSVRKLDVDLLAAAGHKGLLGPLGTGLMYIRDGLENEIRSIRTGGTGTLSESMEQPSGMPGRFESGNLNMPGIAGLNAATEWLLDRGVESVMVHTNELTRMLSGGLAGIAGVRIFGGANTQNVGVVSFAIDNVDCREVATILDQSFAIQCRAGLHCAPLVHERLSTGAMGGTVRLSPGVFSTSEEIRIAIAAVSEIAQSYLNGT